MGVQERLMLELYLLGPALVFEVYRLEQEQLQLDHEAGQLVKAVDLWLLDDLDADWQDWEQPPSDLKLVVGQRLAMDANLLAVVVGQQLNLVDPVAEVVGLESLMEHGQLVDHCEVHLLAYVLEEPSYHQLEH
jgi:hypothetical protein